MENKGQNDVQCSTHKDAAKENPMFKVLRVSSVLAAFAKGVADKPQDVECASKEELQAKALQQLIDSDYDMALSGHGEQCVCQRKEPTVISRKPDNQNWHLVNTWGDNSQDSPSTPIKQHKSGRKLKKTASSVSIKKGCFPPSYFQHHLYYSTHMEHYKNFKLKYSNLGNNAENETTREQQQMVVLPDLSSKTIQLPDSLDPYLSKLANSQ